MLKLLNVLAAVALGCGTTPPVTQPRQDPPPVVASATAPSVSSEAAPSAAPKNETEAADAGVVADAEQVVARLRPGFKSCYNKGLARDPTMAGRIVFSIQVAPSGDVISVTKLSGTGLAAEVEQCIMAKAAHASFSPGTGGTLKVPVTFVQAAADGGMPGPPPGQLGQ